MLPDPDLASSQCLDALEASLKTLLLRTGSALSEQTNLDATNITLTKDRIRRTLPVALDNFHRALGDLELSLTRARSVLCRDYAALQQQLVPTALGDQSVARNGVHAAEFLELSKNISMSESQQPAILSHAVGPPTPLRDGENTTESVDLDTKSGEDPPVSNLPPSDDPLAHPKPSERPVQESGKQISKIAPSPEARSYGNGVSKGPNDQSTNSADSEAKQDGKRNLTEVPASNPNSDSLVAQEDDNSKLQPNASDQTPVKQDAPASNSQSEDVSTLLPDLELYAHDGNGNAKDESFIIENFSSSNTFAANGQDYESNNARNDNDDINADLPDDFLQTGADDGTSFEEQFDFGVFDFGTMGDGDGTDAGGTNNEMQAWESNFLDDSLFNFDGDTGD